VILSNEILSLRIDGPARLRELLASGTTVQAPGCYDALSARLVAEAGFSAAYMTGFGTTASLLGRPDAGFLGMSEMVDNARRIVQAVDIPVIADADTGYGNAVNVIRTVQSYEQAGVAAIHLEDQVMPKKCGHTEGKRIVSSAEMEGKLRAAARARRNNDFVLIARTDARAVEGLDAAIERGKRYREAGADLIFIEAPQSEAEIEQIVTSFEGTPLLFNWAEGGKTPPAELAQIENWGYALVLFPVSTLFVATQAMRDMLAELKANGTPNDLAGEPISFSEFTDLIGFPEIYELEDRFGGG
jgi:carboxyvinyl-carboxyphosphonate phosphorylmutase